MLKKYDQGRLDVFCVKCNETFTETVPDGYESKYLDEFGQYENFMVYCPNCKKNGKNVTIHINLNIPEGEMDEEDLEFQMPLHEINARKYVRDLMWKVRPDLKGKDRAQFNRNRRPIPRVKIEQIKKMFGDFDAKMEKTGKQK
jgi:hypothetical protein